MARSPGSRSTGGPRATAAKGAAPEAPDAREAGLAAFLGLLAEKPFEAISLAEVAARAGIGLAELRGAYGSTFAMVAAFVRRTDEAVLAAEAADMDDQPVRDRLFDVLMRRLDALAPHKGAVRSLADSARRSPALALGLNRLAVRSQQWMLAAAKIETSGLSGALRAQGLAVLFARVLKVWPDDADPGLSRTMAALDRELDRGGRALGMLRSACRMARCGRRGRRATPDSDTAAAAA